MEKGENNFKINLGYQGHVVTVDLRSIVAINHPNDCDKYFCVYFDNMIWKVSIDQHDRLYKLWLNV